MEKIEESSCKIPEADLKRLKEKEKKREARKLQRQKSRYNSQISHGGSKHRGFNYYADMPMDVGPSPEIEK